MSFSLQALIAFLALAITDACWAIYISSVAEKKSLHAACWAVLLFLSGAVAVISYTTNHWLLVPAAAGAFTGTWLGMWWSAHKDVLLHPARYDSYWPGVHSNQLAEDLKNQRARALLDSFCTKEKL